MASRLSFLCNCLIVFMAATNTFTCLEAFVEFKVGGGFAWHQPNPNNTQFYIQWAENNRFQVGDALVFEYEDDSVLSVEKVDYMNCDASNPITAFDNGKSTFNLDRPGNFYFISGTDQHCQNGQKLVVDVMHPHPILKSPPPISLPPQGFPPMATAPPPSDDDQGLKASSASLLLSSIFISLFLTFVSLIMLLAP